MSNPRMILMTATALAVLVTRAPASHEVTEIERGTQITVRTNDYIDGDRRDNRIYTGTVDKNVRGRNGRLGIPRGSQVEMIVRPGPGFGDE